MKSIEADMLAWADTHLPAGAEHTRRAKGEKRTACVARLVQRRFYREHEHGGRWWVTFCDWVQDLQPAGIAELMQLVPYLPPPPARLIDGAAIEDNWLAWIEEEQRYAGKWQETEGDNPPGDAPPEPAAAAAEPVPVAAKAVGLFGGAA